MAGFDGDDDGYSDDDLDALGNEEFLGLELQALQATQLPPRTIFPAAATRPNGRSLRGFDATVRQIVANDASFGAKLVTNHRSSDYGDFDDEVLDAGVENAPSVNTATASALSARNTQPSHAEATDMMQWGVNRFAPQTQNAQAHEQSRAMPTTVLSHRGPSTAPSQTKDAVQNDDPLRAINRHIGCPTAELELEKLRLEKAQWEREKEKLQQDMKAINDQVLGKNGEISIIRSNHARADKEKEQLIAELRKQQLQREELHRLDLEQSKKEKEMLVTNNRFLDHEISDKVWQARQAKKVSNGKKQNADWTPKRQRTSNIGDGFDNDEISNSPSKSPAKSRVRTPKNGMKRKREVFNNSPDQPLQISQDLGNIVPDDSSVIFELPGRTNEADAALKEIGRFEFLQSILGHRIQPGKLRTFEALAGFILPYDPRVPLSMLFMDRMAVMNVQPEIEDFPSFVGDIFISLWSKCLEQRYYSPVRSLLDLVQFVLLNGTPNTVSHLMYDVVRLSQLTADVNVIPRFKTLNKKVKVLDGAQTASDEKPSEEIDTMACLNLLFLTGTLCDAEPTNVVRFWHSMRIDFISMVLRVCQHIDDIIMMANLLGLCVREDQFAAIAPIIFEGQSEGLTSEQHIIDRLSSMLVEVPRPVHGAVPYNPVDLAEMRLQLLLLIEQICDKKQCGRTFAIHAQALGRVVRVMNDELTAIYNNPCGQEQRSEIVNHSCRILFHVTSVYSDEINLQEKLRTQPGGVNKHLIALSRLAFSDAVYFERGIEEDVFDCAHQMLEDLLTPEEAEALKRAFLREEA